MKFWSLVVLVALLLSGTALVSAQNDLVQYVLAVYENSINLETFVYESETAIAQEMNMGAAGMGAMENEVTQTVTVTGIRNEDGFDFSAVSESDMGMMGMSAVLNFELIRVDGVLYGRGSSDGEGMMANIMAEMFPADWTNITEDGERYPGFGAYTAMDSALIEQFANPLGLFPFTPAAVKDLVELDPEEIDGRAVRVFQFDVDFENLDADVVNAIVDTVAGATASSGGAAGAGIDLETMMQDIMQSIEATITIYVDDAEGIILQSIVDQTLDFAMEIPGLDGELGIEQNAVTTISLLEYNTPVTIEAPM
jgi:hypothetical protein